MNNEYEGIIQQVKDGFQSAKGKGYCVITKPVSVTVVLLEIISGLLNKRPNLKILIVIENYSDKSEIVNALQSKIKDDLLANVKFISTNYIGKTIPNYDCTIFIDEKKEYIIEKFSSHSKFCLAIYKQNILNNNVKNILDRFLTFIPVKIDREKINNSRIYSPVEEYRHQVCLSEDDLELSKKYDNYVRDTINIFGDLKTIEYCRNGNPATHQSAMDCRYAVAYRNGWSTSMDKTIEINRQIDELYNPNSIGERVNTVFQITNLRKKLLTNNAVKLPAIKQIIDKEPDKRYLIVSSTGEFCNDIMKYLYNSGYKVTGYHNELEDSYLTDINGQVICYKSGELKGQPKVFKAAALSTNNLEFYNAGYYNIMCIKASCKPDVELEADVIIFTTPLIDNIFEFRQRFERIKLPIPTIIHRIYCTMSNEETTILKEVASSLITLHDTISEQNIMIDEKSGDIII